MVPSHLPAFLHVLPAALMFLAALAPGTVLAQDPPASAPPADENRFGRKYPPRVYTTVHIKGKPPAIDGRLDDEAWTEGEWAGKYTQNTPTEGAAPSQPTELKILYDDKYLYFAIRAYDDPRLVHRYPGRRDDFNGYAVDVVGICFDSYGDKRSGFEFDVTAGGSKIDLVLGNGETDWDTTWDAVWDGKVAHDDKGWTAEVRVPFSQLRYGPQDEQVWGMHAWRWIARNHEEDQWQLIPRQNTGRMYQLGELRGLRGLPRSHHAEILPHALGKTTAGPSVADGGRATSGGAGLDAKVGLTPNFTLDATVNPDFGQVEADPSVMNLTAYETFYEEKRPFFLEGRKILTFALEDQDQLFYSRRIGQAPSFAPPLAVGETAELPENTTILGAFKVSGKTSTGLSVAALQAVTQRETAVVQSALASRTVAVEPLGSYTVGRVQKDWDNGNTTLGAMVTSTHRRISDASVKFLPAQATTGGFDFTRYFAKRSWLLDATGAFSQITGDAAAIGALQTSPVHYYQRPDASHLGVDPSRTSLSGHSGSVRFGRSETTRLRLTEQARWYSPGFDLNDVGYLRQADIILNQVSAGWFETTPKGAFKSYSIWGTRVDQWDFGGLGTGTGTVGEVNAEFKNNWTAFGSLAYSQTVDTRALRGGPALRASDSYNAALGVSTDSAKRAHVSVHTSRMKSLEGGSGSWEMEASLGLRPSNRVSLSAEIEHTRATDDLQYVTTVQTAGGPRWILGRIDQTVWNLTFRANVGLTPEFTIQYYGSPFIATGQYVSFKNATATLATQYEDRFHRYTPSEIGYRAADNAYAVVEGSGTRPAAYSFTNPDFSFQQFRSNVVARWEYKPGSSLYVVWSQGRTGLVPAWDRTFTGNWRGLWDTRPDNILLVKISYWFSL